MRHLVDTNVWLALTLSGHVHHGRAVAWLADITQRRSLLLCRATQQSLLRLLTTATVFRPYETRPLTNREAQAVLNEIAADPRVTFMDEPPDISHHWMKFAARDSSSPKVWMDAYLAAFAYTAPAVLATTDTGFSSYDVEVAEI